LFSLHAQALFDRLGFLLLAHCLLACVAFFSQIQWMQWSLSAAERSPVPVVCALHGACVGAGLDLATACDVRWCAADAAFSVNALARSLVEESNQMIFESSRLWA